MDLSAVSSLLKTVGELITREAISLLGVEEQVDSLRREMRLMLSFLKEADSRKVDNDVVRQCVADIRELAYDIEDVIETFSLKVASRKKGGVSNCIKRSACFMKEGWVRHETKSKIERITARIIELARQLQTYDIRRLSEEGGPSSSTERREARRPYPHIVDEVVGLDDDIKNLVSLVVDEESDCRVVSICGMGGLGKTTLAKKIYRHNQVIRHFNSLAFVYVSQQFQKRTVWEDILTSLTSINERGSKHSDEELAEKLFRYLENNKCLVILDDKWSKQAWDCLKPGFPTARGSSSNFLITSRNKQFVSHADRGGLLYELQCLDDKKGWELFRKVAFPLRDSTENIVDVEMEKLGKEMVHRCAGLPLAIIVLGGILGTRNSVYEWQKVFENVKSYLKRGKGLRVEDVLALSYDDLPPHLRPCFLYFSVFPEDHEIKAKRLIQLWVAEGFVTSEEDGGETMEDVAEGWLVELVERCMVQVGKRGLTLEIKTCRMHDLLRDLCLSMARKENFVCIIDDPSFSPSIDHNVHRIVAHESNAFHCIKSPPLRSMLVFGNPFDVLEAAESFLSPQLLNYFEEHEHEADCNSLMFLLRGYLYCKQGGSWTSLFNNFKLIRVLEFVLDKYRRNDLVSPKFLSAIGDLIHLRFLSLRGFQFFCGSIPSSLGNLKYLKTLDLKCSVAVCGIHIPNVIWKLEQLRHLYLPEPYYIYYKTKLKLDTLTNLQTLVNFNVRNCFVNDLSKLTNLRKLKILVGSIRDFKEHLDKNLPIITSKHLQFLYIYGGEMDPRLVAHLLSSCANLCELVLHSVKINKLPGCHHFPSNITRISLTYCSLEEDPMPTLEKLCNLRILVLENHAFKGKEMVCSAPHFPKLESLRLYDLPIIFSTCQSNSTIKWVKEEKVSSNSSKFLLKLPHPDMIKIEFQEGNISTNVSLLLWCALRIQLFYLNLLHLRVLFMSRLLFRRKIRVKILYLLTVFSSMSLIKKLNSKP